MITPADLFNLVLLSTGALYLGMLAYFNGLVGAKLDRSRIAWNSEPIFWFLAVVLMLAVFVRAVLPLEGVRGPGVWHLGGAGLLLVAYIFLIIKLARHTLPANGFWIIVTLTAVGVLYAVVTTGLAALSPTFSPGVYADQVRSLQVLMTLVLTLILLFKLGEALWQAYQGWSADPHSTERHTATGLAAASAIGDPAAGQASLQQGANAVFDFGARRIVDHGFKADLRILCDNAEQSLGVEVSNDGTSWFACFQDDNISTDWDVPYLDSPWRYVRVTNNGNTPVNVSGVYDLD